MSGRELLWEFPFSPHKRISQVPAGQIQSFLIKAFRAWGMPGSVRIDNGAPLADPQRKRLSGLALWLAGLGVEVIFNRPRRPTDNAKVERMQQATKNWADIENCTDRRQLQQYLDKAICIQRAQYKVRRLGNRTRLECYPGILANTRKYREDGFGLLKAYPQLAQWRFVRQVSKAGQFSLYGQVYYLGTRFTKQYMSIKFNPETIEWEICDSNGKHIKDIPAKNMDKTNILNLTICQRTKKN